MSLHALSIRGLRGFETEQSIRFGLPTGEVGSGLTVVLGPNNAGKSTVVEALRAFSGRQAPSFTEGKRNRAAGDRVLLRLEFDDEFRTELRTIAGGGSETEWAPAPLSVRILALPSRRHFNPYFGRSAWQRDQYAQNIATSAPRGALLEGFSYRLFEIQNNRVGFDAVLSKVITPTPRWAIDQADNGQYYLKFASGEQFHSSEGIGEGLVSVLVLVDALYDSQPGDIIVVDEPELSLHPTFQRRMSRLLADYAATRQIIVATHSPYFLDLSALKAGGRVARVYLTSAGSKISELSVDTGSRLVQLLSDTRNPHVLGLDAREGFFLDDGVILVEGQDDVVHYSRVAEQLDIQLNGAFFGWGVGGADKMPLFAQALKELGFTRVAGLLDCDRRALASELNETFPEFRFAAIPAKDVRSKEARSASPEVAGLLDSRGVLRPEYVSETGEILTSLNAHISSVS